MCMAPDIPMPEKKAASKSPDTDTTATRNRTALLFKGGAASTVKTGGDGLTNPARTTKKTLLGT